MDFNELEKKWGVKKKPSAAWYLLPIFFGFIGGIIGYFVVKDRDKDFAIRLLIVGVVLFVVLSVASFFLAGMAILFLSGNFPSNTSKIISYYNSTCSNDKVIILLRNDGTQQIHASDYSCVQNSGSCSGTCDPIDIGVGETIVIMISGCGPGNNVFDIAGLGNNLQASATCP